MTTLREQYVKDGFVHLQGVFSAEAIDDMRNRIDTLFQKVNGVQQIRTLRLYHILQDEILSGLPLTPQIVESAKKALDCDYVMFGDWGVQKNGFGHGIPGSGWHIDGNSEVEQSYMWEPDYKFAKIGIYFQENTKEWGGGIDLVRASHTMPKIFPVRKLNSKIKQIRDSFNMKFNSEMAPLKKGDVLIFDSRLWHKSSWPYAIKDPEIKLANQIQNFPEEHNKYTFYWDICSPSLKETFLSHSEKRAAEKEAAGDFNPLFGGYLRYHFPTDYPEKMVESLKASGVEMASLPEEKTIPYKKKHPWQSF